jgi:hypothetical protein
MQNFCKLQVHMNWQLLEKSNRLYLDDAKNFFKKLNHFPQLKLLNNDTWIAGGETLMAVLSVLEEKPWFKKYVKSCNFYDYDGSVDNIIKYYGQQ